MLKVTLFGAFALLMACGNDTLRAQTPATTTGPYNTGTTATPGLSAEKAASARGEASGRPIGPIAPAPSLGVTTTPSSTAPGH
jgi:hypothetical protein